MAVQSTPPPPPPQQQQAKPTMTPEQITIVKSTAPLLKEHGVAITSSFYSAMLAAEPALRNVFNAANQATGAQPRALAALVFAFASHIDDGDGGLAALGQRIRGVAHRHVSLQVQPAQYAIVGHHLIAAVARVLGPELVTPAVADAWIAAYAVLADIFIGVEREMYSENQDRTDPEGNRAWPCPSSAAQGDAAGWRPFRIQRRVNESADAGITSFYLVPVTQDNAGDSQQPLPSFKPGQYISLRIPIPESGGGSYLQPRQYSLSDAPGKDYYRISVKREQGKQPLSPAGLVSNILHERYHDGDVVELTHPMGEFHLTAAAAGENEDESEVGRPLVLISAGVGVTPMISILNSVLGDSSNSSSSSINGHAQQQQQQQQKPTRRPVSWIHGAHSASARAFHEHVAHTIASAAARRDGGQEISSHLFLTVSDDSCPTASHAPSSSSDVSSSDKLNIQRQHDYTGRIDLARIPQGEGGLYLDRQHPAAAAAAVYYICGPRGFMDAARAYLVEEKGVDEARVFRELFGTGS